MSLGAGDKTRGQFGTAYAALDLGTNNCRLLIARPTADGFQIIDSYSRIVRLGEGVAASRRLNAEAMGRTLNALRVCAQKIKNRGVKRVRCIATEACRRANNGQEFLDRVTEETGLPFEIVTPELEAELTLHGCLPLFSSEKPKTLLFDIGGGSTEIVWAAITANKVPALLDVLSFPMGVVNLAETHGSGSIGAATFERICAQVATLLHPFDMKNNILQAIQADQVQMIGTSGTITTLGALFLKLERYERAKVDGLQITFQAAQQLIDDIAPLDLAARKAIPCIGPDRADLMVMGCAILNAICAKWPVGALRAADRGIREGLLLEMIEKDRQNTPLSGVAPMTSPPNAFAPG